MSEQEIYMIELILGVGGQPYRAFLQDGFRASITTARLHKHNYAEIHIVTGDMAVDLGSETQKLKTYTAMIIPSGSYHRIIPEKSTRRISFQIEAECTEPKTVPLHAGVVDALFSEAESCFDSGDFSVITAFLSLVATELLEKRYSGEKEVDYSLSIREFFSRRYSENVRLCDLADELHLSERQTERLVIKHTGRSFRDELTATRMAVADQLISEGKMPLGEICSYVGYRSYAGFFKARKAFDK